MKRCVLNPNQIFVPGEYELHDPAILQIYFRVFERGHGEDLPPVIVTKCNVAFEELSDKLERVIASIEAWRINTNAQGAINANSTAKKNTLEIRNAYHLFERIVSKVETWYLIDGNHKSAAATLAQSPLYALELQSDADLVEVRKMVERGELFNFNDRSETSLRDLVQSFEEYILGNKMGNCMHMEAFRTVKERVDLLVSEGNFPQYMIDKYFKN